jgi:hypothetical protein
MVRPRAAAVLALAAQLLAAQARPTGPGREGQRLGRVIRGSGGGHALLGGASPTSSLALASSMMVTPSWAALSSFEPGFWPTNR